MTHFLSAAIFAFFGMNAALGQDAGVAVVLPGTSFAGNYRVTSCTDRAAVPPVNGEVRLVSRMQAFPNRTVPVLLLQYVAAMHAASGTVTPMGALTAINVPPLSDSWEHNGDLIHTVYTARTAGLEMSGSHQHFNFGSTRPTPPDFIPVMQRDSHVELRFADASRRILNYRLSVAEVARGASSLSVQECVFTRR